MEETVLKPIKEGTEKAAADTKHAFEDLGEKMRDGIVTEIKRSKEPGGVFAKETYVDIGQKIKEVRRLLPCAVA